jgi:hypothetical protein
MGYMRQRPATFPRPNLLGRVYSHPQDNDATSGGDYIAGEQSDIT